MNEIKELMSAINLCRSMQIIHGVRAVRLENEAIDEKMKVLDEYENGKLLTEKLHEKLFGIMLITTPCKFLKLLEKLGLE